MENLNFDLVVIGGGPAGTSGALAAAIFGKKVALIEKAPVVGGAGINTGTIPSKALRESALVISGWRARKLMGVEVSMRREAKLSEFTYHERQVAEGERRQLEARLRERRVQLFQGRSASFLDPHTVKVEAGAGEPLRLRGDVILIATGSSPARPREFPFEHPRVHDPDEILEIVELPQKLAVVGAGVIGAEYACTFAALGVEVHLIDGRDMLLPFLDREVSTALTKAMERGGVQFHWQERVRACHAPASGDVKLTLTSGRQLLVTDVLVAAGRSSNTGELNLLAAGLTPSARDVLNVDSYYRTGVSHIYAAGDVIGPPALAATSMEQARVAVCHAFNLLEKGFAPILPTGIYTIPEVSMVGETEESLTRQSIEFVAGRALYSQNPRGRLIGDEAGFLKLLFRRTDMRLMGVHVIGEQATDLVHIGLMALLGKGDAELFNHACFNYPTLGDLYKYATYDALLQTWTEKSVKALRNES